MRAVQVQHADTPAAIAEHHQVLAEDSGSQRRRRELARECDGLPEAAQILATRRARTDLGQLGIRRGNVAAAVAVERTGFRLRGARSGSLHGTSSLAPTSEPSQAAGRLRMHAQPPGKTRRLRAKLLPSGRYERLPATAMMVAAVATAHGDR